MKKAVMYGCGNIGRGFIGQTFSLSGYEVVFIDVVQDIVDAINRDRRYPVCIISDDGMSESFVENVRAVNGIDVDAAAHEIATADLMATAVGVNALAKITASITKGIALRFQNNNTDPLNIIICENMLGADNYLRELIEKELSSQELKTFLKEKIGFVEASIGRMVPIQTDDMKRGNPLRVCVESYDELPVDEEAFKGEIPSLKNLKPFTPFSFYIKRKLFVHNMGHATAAYLGRLKNYTYIYEAIRDKEIEATVRRAMTESARALIKEYDVPEEELCEHVSDLISRFGNRGLKDTVLRVGGDPIRKLSEDDRMAGAIRECLSNGIEPRNICMGMAAGTLFTAQSDPSAVEVQSRIKREGIEAFLSGHSKVPKELINVIIEMRDALKVEI